MKGKKGFTLVEIMIVVAIIGLLAAIAIPSFVKARSDARAKACVNNLRLIDAAKEQWAMATNKPNGYNAAAAFTAIEIGEINEYLKGGVTPTCPAKGIYDYTTIGTNPTCSYAATNPDHALPGV